MSALHWMMWRSDWRESRNVKMVNCIHSFFRNILKNLYSTIEENLISVISCWWHVSMENSKAIGLTKAISEHPPSNTTSKIVKISILTSLTIQSNKLPKIMESLKKPINFPMHSFRSISINSLKGQKMKNMTSRKQYSHKWNK